jgi:O-antigen ligase
MQQFKFTPKIIIYLGVILTLILTPWVNLDSLVVPKVIVLFCLAAYLIPQVALVKKTELKNIEIKILYIISILIIAQMLLVLTLTSAPIEQQIFGRGGRGLGFLTYFSLIVILIVTALRFSSIHAKLIIFGLLLSAGISSAYSVMQNYNLDVVTWVSRTNGVIGTIGNPNFQSAFAATALILVLTFIQRNNLKNMLLVLATIFLLIFTIYICKSTQGYVAAIVSIITFISLYLRTKTKKLFYLFSALGVLLIFAGVLGVFKSGPLSGLLYKYSIKSRAEMWRTSLTASSDNPFFGVGLDSFGDYSSYYKSEVDAAGVNEFTDNSHNYFLEHAVTGGYPLLVLHMIIIVLTLYAFFKVHSGNSKFDKHSAALFSAWIALQAQSLVSPASIPLLFWTFVISGYIIGSSVKYIPSETISKISSNKEYKLTNNSDALLAVKVAKMYPESSSRYQRLGLELTKAGLMVQALEVARAAVEFNPNSFTGWALVLANDLAPLEEKKVALEQLKRLDPFNKMLKDVKL